MLRQVFLKLIIFKGKFNINYNLRQNPQSERAGSIFCIISIILYSLIVFTCVLYALYKGDNFLKWLFLYTTHCIHIIAFFISLDFELPINLRVYLHCLFNHLIKWLGSFR